MIAETPRAGAGYKASRVHATEHSTFPLLGSHSIPHEQLLTISASVAQRYFCQFPRIFPFARNHFFRSTTFSMQSPIVSNTRNQGDRQRTQSGSVPFPGSSMRGNAYGTQRHSDSMATFSTHSSAQVGASDNAQILSGDFMDDGDGGAPNNNSQAQLTEKPNYLNEFWAALQK